MSTCQGVKFWTQSPCCSGSIAPTVTFPTSSNFPFWAPSQSFGAFAAPRCTVRSPTLTNLLPSLPLSVVSLVNLCPGRLVHPLQFLFLAAPAVLVRQPLHVWTPAVRPLHHVDDKIPCSFRSRHSRLCGWLRCTRYLHLSIQNIVNLRLVECRTVWQWFCFSLLGNPWRQWFLWNNGFCRCE